MMTKAASQVILLTLIVRMFGCGGSNSSGPPEVRFGESICDECGMILSDERFAFATLIAADRGRESLVFDDSICQHKHEQSHPELVILERWAHDYNSHQWFPEASAVCVRSEQIKTPMASHVAFFKNKADALALAEQYGAEVVEFDQLWAGAE